MSDKPKVVPHIRDSKDGKFITQRQADRKDPATWEREHIKYPKK